MYKKILLATDGTRESLIALREGALLAATYKAAVFLLVIEREAAGSRIAEGVYPVPTTGEGPRLLELGLDRLRRLGLKASGAAVIGEPALIIGGAAKKFDADLVVVGHRKQGVLERWWSGSSGAHLVDHVTCSVMVARNVISDEEFEAHLDTTVAAG
jgi:nucleotide-binding universal stress UspA family protein